MNATRTEAEIQQLIRMLRATGVSDTKALAILITEMYLEMTEEQKNSIFSKIEKDYSGKDLTS
tara:strand:- start:269 stop:457 length:189 start_codon:yes stop_codon:yes gene_type:complete